MRLSAKLPRLFAALFLAAGMAAYPGLSNGITAKTVPFIFSDIEGKPLRLADYRGQWVLVAFWAPWCPLCKIQTPALKALDSRPDLTVIGVGLDYDSTEQLRATADSYGLDFRIVAGGKRRNTDSPHLQVGPVDFFPTSYLYDPTGEIAMYIPGQVNKSKVLAFMDNWRSTPGAAAVASVAKTDKLATFLKRHYGKTGEKAYAEWRQLVDRHAAADTTKKLRQVNDFFNRRLLISNDQRIWGQPDHWATLGEVLGKGAGDAEDFVLAKYFTLLAMNTPPERLRLVYVRSRDDADPVHMVLAYFEANNQEPLLLDNRVADVLPASRRADLKPVYSFNGTGAWGDAQALTGGRPNTPWEDTLRRARDEGFN